MYNPSLREEPREQLAQVIPLQQETSLLNWLESSGRLIPRDKAEVEFPNAEEEISELMGVDDTDYDDDDDDEPTEEDA